MWGNDSMRSPHDFFKMSDFFPDGSGNFFRKQLHRDIYGAEVGMNPLHFAFPAKSPCFLSVFLYIYREIAILSAGKFQQQGVLRPAAELAVMPVIVLVFADNW